LPSENRLAIVGIGPGSPGLRTPAAEEAIKAADFVVGYKPYLELIRDLLPGKKVVSGSMGRELGRVKAAVDLLQEGSVALVSSGDPNVYGMAGLGLELAPDPSEVEIVPGVTSFTAAACSAGVFFRESVAVISLSDLLTPWQEIEGRLRLASELKMPVALYNPRSRRRDWQLSSALESWARGRPWWPGTLAAKTGAHLDHLRKLVEDDTLRERIDMTCLVILGGKEYPGRRLHPGRSEYRGYRSRRPGPHYPGGKKDHAALNQDPRSRALSASGWRSLPAEKVVHTGPFPERMAARFQEAKNAALRGEMAAVLTGGDPSIFSSGWRIMDQARGNIEVHISPGVSAFSSVAAKAGAPLVNDFVLLSEAQNPSRISAMANAGFGVVIYNVKGHEIVSLLQEIDPARPCALARDVAREGEEMMILTTEDLQCARPSGFRFTLLVASANSFIKNARIITRRGYENKYRY